MRPKSLILLILALGCGLVASVGINQVMANRRNVNTTDNTETVPVLIALTAIGIGDPIKPEMLKLEQWPKTIVPAGTLGKLEEIEGRLSRVRFVPGEPILEAKLLAKGEKLAAASTEIPIGMRLATVRVDAVSSSSGLILPGDHVDVLVHMQASQSRGIPETTTLTFLHNIKVFAVDDLFSRNTEDKSVAAKTVSLLVTPKQSELVMLAGQLGPLQLVMRSALDEGTGQVGGGVTVEALLNQTGGGSGRPVAATGAAKNALVSLLEGERKPAKPKPEPNAWVMELIEGSDVKEFEFAHEDRAGKPVTGGKKKPGKAIQPLDDGAQPTDEPPAGDDQPGNEETNDATGEGSKQPAGGDSKPAPAGDEKPEAKGGPVVTPA